MAFLPQPFGSETSEWESNTILYSEYEYLLGSVFLVILTLSKSNLLE